MRRPFSVKLIVFLSLVILFSTAFLSQRDLANAVSPSENSSSFENPFKQQSIQKDMLTTSQMDSSQTISIDKIIMENGYPGISPSPTHPAVNYKIRDYSPSYPSSPVVGTRNILVILIDFSDRVGTKDNSYFQNLLFSGKNGSLSNYYQEASYNLLTLNISIAGAGWYRSNHSLAWWGKDSSTGHDDANGNVFELAREAVLKADADVNFSRYDTNKDGVIGPSELSLCIIHAGYGQELSKNSNDIWSHSWYIYGSDFVGGKDTVVDGVRISSNKNYDAGSYFMVAELSPLGVFAHEYGHQLGLPDLYDYDNPTKEFLGRWDLMAEGSWNGDPTGTSPAHLTSWSKIKLGWINSSNMATVSTRQTVNYTVSQLETKSSGLYAVKILRGSTYYLVEFRQKILYDSSLPGSGVLVLYCNDSLESGKGPVRLQDAHPSTTDLNDAAFGVNSGQNSTFVDRVNHITITVMSISNSSCVVKVNYDASNFRVQTYPAGLRIQIDGINYTTSQSFMWTAGSNHTVSVFSPLTADGTGYIFVRWSDGKPQSHSFIVNSTDVTLTATYRIQYEIALTFRTSSNLSDISSPRQCRLFGASPNSSLITVSEYSHVWLDDVNWTVVEVLWQGSNVAPNTGNVYAPTPFGRWSIICNVYWLNLTFNDSSGRQLYVGPSSYGIMFPNGTLFTGRTATYYSMVQSGTMTITSMVWQGNEVVPRENKLIVQPTAGRDFSGVTWNLKCQIYGVDFSSAFKDGSGRSLDMSPSSFSLVCPNSTKTTLLPVGTYTLQNGTYAWDSIVWKGVNVVPSPSATFSSADGDPRVNCRVYDLSVNVKDIFGLAISGVKVEARMSNNTIIASGITDSVGKTVFQQLPIGSYGVDIWLLGLKTSETTISLTDGKNVNLTVLLSNTMIYAIAGIILFLTVIIVHTTFKKKIGG